MGNRCDFFCISAAVYPVSPTWVRRCTLGPTVQKPCGIRWWLLTTLVVVAAAKTLVVLRKLLVDAGNAKTAAYTISSFS